jgi:hypothetical protein
MRFVSSVLILACAGLSLLAGGAEQARLDYRLKVRLRGDPATVEGGFRIIATPPLTTRNKVKRLRMGTWQLEPLTRGPEAPSPVMLARALALCYFSGPPAQAVPLTTGMRLGKRWCRMWQVQTPPQVGAYAYLVEVAPGLLALAYLSANLPGGDIQSMEIHLAGMSLGTHPAPVEDGTALLRTLRQWANQSQAALDPGLETEAVP